MQIYYNQACFITPPSLQISLSRECTTLSFIQRLATNMVWLSKLWDNCFSLLFCSETTWISIDDFLRSTYHGVIDYYQMKARETKLQSLQFKIVHRIIPCKKWLHEQKVISSPSCEMCKEEKVDDMTHHFMECSGLNNFWNIFENWWNRTATYQIQ